MRFHKKLAATYSPTFVVPSALAGLTSLFGMGRGEPCRCNHPKSASSNPSKGGELRDHIF